MSAASLRTRGSLAGVLALALTATACGGASSTGAAKASATTAAAAAAATTTAAGSAAASTTATSPAGASAPAATTTAAAPTTAAPTAAATTKVKATGGGDFCKSIANAINNPVKPGGTSTPADEKALIQSSLAQGEAALSKAPSAIKPDVVVVLGAVDKLLKALEAANYDYSKIDATTFSALSDPKVTAAEAHVVAYVKTSCGIDVAAAASG
jgi:hypothetical protein